ncbi:hypothetical protein [Oceaniglobus ichthyenteri]|uniref:hypothetical protein n=1 Tax=Oceaniglobus ichthyenteri TaxID=2136177 RepID=UPI000F81BDE1|nr:hypothetical protein [Oceaniglobus ichthyenteri]
MACLAVFFSTAVAISFTGALAAFANPSVLDLVLGYLVVAKLSFWLVILRCTLRPARAEG